MASSRKVVILGSSHPLRGGLATYNERLAKAFQENGDDVTIFTFSLQYPSFLFPGKTQYSSEPAPDGLDIRVTVNSINPVTWIKTGRKIKKLKPDLLIIKYWLPFMAPCFGTIARIAKKNRHTRVISILDNIIPHEKRLGDKAFTRYFVKPVDAFIAMSKSVMAELDLFNREKPRIFNPHPLYDNFGSPLEKDVAKRNLRLDGKCNYLLFFGFIRDYKGLDLLLKAMASKKLANHPLKLLVAGEFYTKPEPYFKLIQDLGIGERVIMANDFIPDSKVANYFCAADLVVQPYKDATQSGVTQIAYHFNKPMIVTDVGGLSEIVTDQKVGYVVNPDPEEIAAAIEKFYTEEKEAEFSENTKNEKKKYSWEQMIKNIYLLTETLEKQNHDHKK